MGASNTIIDEAFALTRRYRVILNVLEVPKSKKHPEGVKAKFVLIDVENGCPRFLIDNHQPYGWHMHTSLPDDKDSRLEFKAKDHNEALDIFLLEV